MATSTDNLQELTVTCSQCGSASMERLGPREYRCNHCGAITVVSQSAADEPQAAAAQSRTAAPTSYTAPSTSQATSSQASAGGASHGGRVWLFVLAVAGAILLYNVVGSTSSKPSGPRAAQPAPTVPGSQLTLSPAVWSSTTSDGVTSGQYTAMLTNKSAWPVEVPRYSMTLYVRGVQGPTAYSSVPMPRLMPGEYEPIAFAFETPRDEPRTEISAPATAARASVPTGTVSFSKQQLVHEDGKTAYRMVGLVTNNGGMSISGSEVMVMLFGKGHALLGYGRAYTRALRSGEQAAVDIPIPSNNVNPVVSYEYITDASTESGQ